MGLHSSVLIIMLTFAIMLSFLYLSQLNQTPPHDPSVIPTEPRITQAQAIDIAEQEYGRLVPEYQEAHLHFYYYNFSRELYENDERYQRYISNIWPGWNLTIVKAQPDLLNLNLAFVHANGTVYWVNATNQEYEKACEEPANDCVLGKRGGEAARDRLVYEVGALVHDHDIHIAIDAETGELVWSRDSQSERPTPNVDIYDNMSDAMTVREQKEAKLNPPEITEVQIADGASSAEQAENFVPKEARGVWEISHKVRWTNHDAVLHTVTSDNNYSNEFGDKFESGVIEPSDSYEFAFTEEGEFPYHCNIHPWMRGSVEIVPSFA